MLRIGYLTYGLDRAPTGIGRYTVELLRALAQRNEFELVLLTTEREDKHDLWNNFEHHALPGCYLLPALLTLGNTQVSWASAKHRLDLIHDPNGVAPFLGPSFGARRVVTIHDALPFVFPATHNKLDNLRYHTVLPIAARNSNVVLTDSQCSADDLQRYLRLRPTRTKVVYCGLSSRFAPQPDNEQRKAVLAKYNIDAPYLLYVGGINARKNLARLIQAFDIVRQSQPELKLVIGGKRQWVTADMDQALAQSPNAAAVLFTGYLDDADLPALYSAASVFAFPSVYEGFGLPPLEAMACGAAVVTSSTSSLAEVVGDAALTVEPTDTAAIAAAITRILENPTLAKELGAKGQTRAKQFTWERAAQQTAGVYRRLLAKKLKATAA